MTYCTVDDLAYLTPPDLTNEQRARLLVNLDDAAERQRARLARHCAELAAEHLMGQVVLPGARR